MMQCPSCGNELEATDRFCPLCGTAVNAGAQNAPGGRNVQNAPGAPSAQNTENIQNVAQTPGIWNAQNVQNTQNVPMQPPGYHYGMQSGGQPFYPGPEAFQNQPPLTRKMFFSMYASAKVRNGIRTSAIFSYFCAALTGFYGWLALGNPFMWLDAIIIAVLGVLIHVKQSKVASVILLVYSTYGMIAAWVTAGAPTGWLIVLAAISAVHASFSLDKEYKAYCGQ